MSANMPSEGDIRRIDVEAEAGRLYHQLCDFGDDAVHEGDPGAVNTYLRLSTALFEKLVELQERARKVKEVDVFHNLVLEIMETELTGDQRTRIISRLREHLEHD